MERRPRGSGWGKLTLEAIADMLELKRLSRFTRLDAQSLEKKGDVRAALQVRGSRVC
jgi:hypothetical protein